MDMLLTDLRESVFDMKNHSYLKINGLCRQTLRKY
jgi:hypothetical protein